MFRNFLFGGLGVYPFRVDAGALILLLLHRNLAVSILLVYTRFYIKLGVYEVWHFFIRICLSADHRYILPLLCAVLLDG